jgi:hypothetical protein
VISRPDTVVLGLGLPSLVPTSGRTALRVESGEGVFVSGLVVDAGALQTEVLVQFGLRERNAGSAGNPTCIHDLVCRVEGDAVTIYGLSVEHTQKHQTLWMGERGRVLFYQSEIPYDPPSQHPPVQAFKCITWSLSESAAENPAAAFAT